MYSDELLHCSLVSVLCSLVVEFQDLNYIVPSPYAGHLSVQTLAALPRLQVATRFADRDKEMAA